MKKIVFSIIIGIFFLFLSTRGVDKNEIINSFSNINYIYLMPVIVLQFLTTILRAFRLKILYDPLEKIDILKVYGINCVGYLFIFLIPMRLGEFIIPYLIKKNTKISLSSAMAAIVVERFTDLFILLILLTVSISDTVMPIWLEKSKIYLGFFFLLGFAGMIFIYTNPNLFLGILLKIIKIFPHSVTIKIELIFREFIKGLSSINSFYSILKLLLISSIIWLLSAYTILNVLNIFNIDLKFSQSVLVMSINTIGIALPSGPGMIGNFQYSCILAFELFGINRSLGFAIGNFYYFIGIGFTILIGICFLPHVNLSYQEIKHDIKRILGIN